MTALSFFVGIGCVGCIIMPSLSTMLFKISPTLPYLLFGIMALLSIIITAFLPETHKMNLDDEHDDWGEGSWRKERRRIVENGNIILLL